MSSGNAPELQALHEEFYASAAGALARDASAEIAWRDADPPAVGLAALCRAQGYTGAPGYAIGDLTIAAGAVRRGDTVELALFPQQAGSAVFWLDGGWFTTRVTFSVPGAALDQQLSAARVATCEPCAEPADLALARLGAAFDLLGCADALIEMAVAYARDRRQFGRSIGEFQAVQHLLAETHVAREGLRALCREALASSELAPIAKAYGGSATRRIAQTTLQVLGAIGFTMEHSHHRFYRRVMVLDAAFGSSRELYRALGRQASAGTINRLIAPR